MRGATMKWVGVTFLAIALAGCADSGIFDREKSVELVTPTEQVLPPAKPVRPRAQAAKAEASKPDAAKNHHCWNAPVMPARPNVLSA